MCVEGLVAEHEELFVLRYPGLGLGVSFEAR